MFCAFIIPFSLPLYISLFLSLPLPLLCSPNRLLVTSLPCCPWLCTTDCVLYQSLTCVLVQHLPVPCSRQAADPYAVAAVTERKARLLLCLRMPSPVWHRWADNACQLPLWNEMKWNEIFIFLLLRWKYVCRAKFSFKEVFKFFKEVSNACQGCIYLIKSTVKSDIVKY